MDIRYKQRGISQWKKILGGYLHNAHNKNRHWKTSTLISLLYKKNLLKNGGLTGPPSTKFPKRPLGAYKLVPNSFESELNIKSMLSLISPGICTGCPVPDTMVCPAVPDNIFN